MLTERDGILKTHPCFSDSAHFMYGRVHLPVAPRCNIACLFCDRRYDCVNESRPGVTSELLSPQQALERAEAVFAGDPSMKVAGIAGPGEPLYNEETFETMSLIRKNVPGAVLCLSSNGLLVCERIRDMKCAGADTLTVTVNSLCPESALRIYADVFDGCSGTDRAQRIGRFLEKHQKGITDACRKGFTVKINTVLIPGINDSEIEQIASFASSAGAYVMNIMPLIPCGSFSDRPAPSAKDLSEARRSAGKHMRLLSVCSQCRADACGIPGRKESRGSCRDA